MPIQLKCTVAYVVANLLTNGLSLLTMPVFTRIMSASDMGDVTAFNSWQAILTDVITLSLSSGSFSVAMLEYKEHRDEYISSILTLSSISAVLSFGVYVLFKSKLDSIFMLDSELMLLMFAGFLLTPAMTFWILRERFEYKYKSVLFITLISAFFSTALSVIAVVLAKNNGLQRLGVIRLYGSYLPSFIIAAALYIIILVRGKTFFDSRYWFFSLKLSLPLILHTLSKHILDVSDRIMIDRFLGKSELGIYGVLYTASSLSMIVWSAINSSLIPITFNKLEKRNFKDLNEILKPIIILYAVVCAVLSLFSPEIVRIIATEEYYSAIYLMPPISAGIFFTCMYTIFGNVLTFYRKTTSIMFSTLLAASINVILNYVFIPRYGVIAASYTTLFAYIFLTIFQMIAVRRLNEEEIIENKFLGLMIVITILWSMLCNILYQRIYYRMGIIFIIVMLCVYKHNLILNNIKNIFRER